MLGEAAIYLKQKGLLCDRKGERPHVTPNTQEAPLMRLSVASLRRVVKGDLRIEFVRQDLTSYGGLELLRRYVRRIGLSARLQAACAQVSGDYGGGRLSLLILSLFYVGARRLEQLRYLGGDPLITRFCGLARMPSARTVVNWLKQFTQTTLAPLVQLNQDLVLEAITRLKLPRLTIDVDGTVVRTGATVAWAFRGFNPHHRKDPSYYPLLAHLAQTGHILRLKNRPGNVHDSKQAVAFLRELIDDLRTRFGRRLPLEFRMDAAFCQPAVFRLLTARDCRYAIKVGYWHWLPLKQLAADRQRWLPVVPNVTGFFHDLDIPQWQLRLRVMIYRKHVRHESPKNFQLDLFTPDDGHFEYAAVATNLALDLPALYAFICGRGAQEKTIAELKGEFALDVVPTNHYGANSAWQQLSILAYNVARSFQLDTLPLAKPRSRKRTYAYVLRSIRTLRFLFIARAGRLTRIGGRNVLRLSHNPATKQLYDKLADALAA
jgi:Transposase DDE domain group 1